MNDTFEARIRTASAAGWGVVLIFYGMLLLQWGAYVWSMTTHPEWLLRMWGPGVDWPYVQNQWMWGMIAFKMMWGAVLMTTVWLTLWAKQLRRQSRP